MNPKTFLRRLAKLRLVRVLAVLVGVYGLLGFLLVPVLVKAQLPKRLSPLLHREVTVGRVRTNPFALSVTLDGLRIKDRDGSELVGWDRLYVNLSLQSLFRLAPVFQEISLEGFHAHVVLDAQGNPTFADLLVPSKEPAKPAGAPPEVRIQHLRVAGARVTFIDHHTPQTFQTVLGPLDFSLDGFRLAKDNRSPYAFSGRTERGETFDWEGQILLDPFRSKGTFHIGKLFLPKYAPFYRDSVGFDLLGGTLDAKAAYEFGAAPRATTLRILDGEVGLDGLSVAEKGHPAPAIDLPELRARGLAWDMAGARASLASLVLRNGRLQVRREADGTLNLLRLSGAPKAVGAPVKAVPSAKAAAPEAPARPFRFDLGELRVENQSVTFQDLTPRRPVLLDLDQAVFVVKGFTLDKAATCAVEADLRWNGKGRIHAAGQVAPMAPSGALDLKVEDLDLAPLNGYLEPAGAVEISAGRLQAEGRTGFDLPAARYGYQGQARIDGFKAALGADKAATLGWDALRLAGIRAASKPMAVTLASIDWDRPAGRYVLAAAAPGKPAAPAAAPAQAAGAPASPAPAPAPKAEIGAIRIHKGAFTFLDTSIQPLAALSLDAVEAKVGRLTSDPGARGSLDLTALVDGAAPLRAAGTVNLLSQAAFTDVIITMDGMDLSPLSPYAGKYVGFPIEKGKLLLDLKYLVQDRKLDAANRVRMDQFTLGEATGSPDALHLPVKLGLALLRDRHGLIDLDVPVGGDLGSPDFHLGKVIWRAVVNIFTKIVTSPFNLIAKAFGGGDADLSLLEFKPGSDAIDAQGLKVLQTLEKGLAERPGLRLDLEGTTREDLDVPALKRADLEATLERLKGQPVTPEDRPRFLKAAFLAVFPPDKAKPAPEPPPDQMEALLLARIPVDAAALKLLARRRVQAARDHLLQAGKVEEERVFVVEGGDRAKKEGGCRVFFELK